MRVFITGIAGFLGSHLADTLLEEGHQVAGNDSFVCGDRKNIPDGASFYQVDCCDFDRMKEYFDDFKPDVVVHAAATAHEGLSSFSPSFITRNIYEASVATFSAAIASGVKRIVYMSSMSRYGKECAASFNGPPFEEWFKPNPVDPYAVSKVAAEDTLKILCKTHGVDWSILVPHSIIGTRQKYDDPARNVASIMINRCLQGKPPIIYGDGSQVRDFSPVADCIPSIVKAVHGEADGEIVNIGPDAGGITVAELAKKIMVLCGYEGDPTYFPDRPNEVKVAHCSSAKSRRLLGYKERQSVDDCLEDMVAAVRKSGTKEFNYFFPIEIENERTPQTWTKKLI